MNHKNVLIKTKEQMVATSAHPDIKKSLEIEARSKTKGVYPLTYKYLGVPGIHKDNNVTTENTIGSVTNIRYDANENIVADVSLEEVKNSTKHFSGIIDSTVVRFNSSEDLDKHKSESIVIDHFIIFDKFAKSIIDERNRKSGRSNVVKTTSSPIADVTPMDKSENPLFNPSVKESLHNSIKEEFGNAER